MILKSTNKNLKYKILLYPKITYQTLFNHSIFTIKYGDLDHKHPINYLNGIKEIICKYQREEKVIKQSEIC